MIALNNVTTGAAYSSANTIAQGGTNRVNLQVQNAAIYWQFAPSLGQGFQPEEFLAPGLYSFDRRCEVARIRSANSAAPAQVTLTLLTSGDTGA